MTHTTGKSVLTPYSPYFMTLREESVKPTKDGLFSNHYSILRAPVPHLSNGENFAAFTDFSIIWDRDHDTRIIFFAELLLHLNALSDILLLRETKGQLVVISSDNSDLRVREMLEVALCHIDDDWRLHLYTLKEFFALGEYFEPFPPVMLVRYLHDLGLGHRSILLGDLPRGDPYGGGV
jgi:hypothetical protein